MDRSDRAAAQRRLGALLRAIRHEQSLRQAEVAARLGRPQSFVSKYENGERRLDVIELREVCGALGTQVARLLQRLDAGEPSTE